MNMARDLTADLQIRSVVDQITAPALVIGADLRIQHLNGPMTSSLKPFFPEPDTLLLRDLVAPADWADVSGRLNNTKSAGFITFAPTDQTIALSPLGHRLGGHAGYFGIAVPAADVTGPPQQVDRWQTILANIEEGIWDFDVVKGDRFRSDGWRRIRGLAPRDSSRDKREDWLRGVHPDDREAVNAVTHGFLSGGLPTFEVTYRERHSAGHWIWITCKGRVTKYDNEGRVLHIVASDSDVTKTREVETRLRTMETWQERWKIAVESAGQGLWDHDLVVGTRYCSDIWRTLRGFAPDDHTRELEPDWSVHIHPDDQERLRAEISKVDRGETDEIRYEYRERRSDGHYIWILSRGRVVSRLSGGSPARIIGNDTDITEIKSRSEDLECLSKTLELAVTTAGIGIWEFNPTTGESMWDRQMYNLYGLPDDGSADTTDKWERHLHPDDYEIATAEASRSIKKGEEFNIDYRVVRPDKTLRYVRSRAAHFRDRSGQHRVIGVNWDITSDRERAEFLHRANKLANEQNEALEAARAKMEYDALHDALTGLANRRKLDEFERAFGDRSTVLHIDLDRFKQINDTLGHAAGDKVIIHAAKILQDTAPEDALVARVGGDEFVIFLPNTPGDEQLEELATKIITAAQRPVEIDGHKCRFGMSVGIATARDGKIAGTTLFANADMALYLAKNEGRGRFRFYTEALKIATQSKNKLTDEILAGLQNNEFYCIYQPQFDAKTLDLSGVEALVRWRHPDGTIRAPDSFLPVAEELNVVSRIDQIVLDQAIADTLKWQAAGLPVPRMSVNVSARRLTDPALPEKLACLRKAPGKFSFELLESVFLDTQDSQLSSNLAYIREMGIDIEIDDFGTGHASIVGVLRLRPNRLTIDRELVGPVDTSPKRRLLIKSIVEIGKIQGIGVVAEGVETPVHIDVLRDLGCDHLQGYGLASPMPGAQLMALLNAAHSTGTYRPYDKSKVKT